MRKQNRYQRLVALTKHVKNNEPAQRKICIAVPTTGNVRIEWMMGRYGCILPINWSHGEILQYFDQFSPIGYVVADARNICVEYSIAQKFEWTLFIDHDTIIPPTTFLLLGEWMRKMTHPIVGGLYYCKGSHPEPLVFRGRGTGYYDKWKFGDAVEVDALPMGCTLIHNSILKYMYDNSEVYTVGSIYGPVVVRRVFQTPKLSWQDPESGRYNAYAATEDLPLFDRIIKEGILEKTGWKKAAKQKYPFICDTRIFCQHIDEAGIQYPGQMYKNTKQYKGSDLEKIEKKGVFNVGQSKGCKDA